MYHPFSLKRLDFRIVGAALLIASASLLVIQAQTTQPEPALPNVAVYEVDPTHGDDALHTFTKQVSLHAPGTLASDFVVPSGRYVTPNGHYAMAMPSPGLYQIWDLMTDKQIFSVSASVPGKTPTSMAVSPGGSFAAVSSLSTTNHADWTVNLFNLSDKTQYTFSGTTNTATATDGSTTLQAQPQILGWTGDGAELILSTSAPASGAATGLYFRMPMDGIAFATPAAAGSPIPPVTALGADQPITRLVFSRDSMRAAFLYANPNNTAFNFQPVGSGPSAAPPNGLRVIDLTSGTVTPIVDAAAGQGMTAPAWDASGQNLYFGAGPFQSTPFPVNVHLFTYNFDSKAIIPGDVLITTDPAHVGVSDMQVCNGQLFMREVSIISASGATAASTSSKITSAPMDNIGVHSDVYTTAANGLGPCVPNVHGSATNNTNGVLPSIPTAADTGSTVSGLCTTATVTPSSQIVRPRPNVPVNPTATFTLVPNVITNTPTPLPIHIITNTPVPIRIVTNTPTFHIIRFYTYTPTPIVIHITFVFRPTPTPTIFLR